LNFSKNAFYSIIWKIIILEDYSPSNF